MAAENEVIEQLQLGGLDGCPAGISAEQKRQDLHGHPLLGEQLRHGYGGLEHPRGVHHVPEVEDSADPARARIDQDVVSMAVAMDCLAAQRAQGGKALLERGRGVLHAASQVGRLDIGGMLDQLRQPPDVPGQALTEPGVKEALQCRVQPGERTP
jgi:hypothetical protein